jgi:hypothetical protein
MKKILLFLLLIKLSFACCCVSSSCNPVKASLSSAIKKAEVLLGKNDNNILGKYFKDKLNKILAEINKIQIQIYQTVSNINGLKKTQAYYQLAINKKLQKIEALYILLNEAKLLNSKNIILTNKELFYKSLLKDKGIINAK